MKRRTVRQERDSNGHGGAAPVRVSLTSAARWPTTSRRRSSTSTRPRIWGTRTPRSVPTSSRGTCASAGRRSSSSPGTDEHGEPVAQAAEREGVTPKELADRNAERFKALIPRINVTNDFFIRTSDPRHKRAVQDVMQRIHDNGYTYKGTYEGLYCPRCADFKTEQEIGPDETCPIHKIPLEHQSEENWFFKLSAFQEPLEQLYARPARLRAAAHPLQRGARRSSPAASTTSRSAARRSPGASRSRGTRATSSTSGSTRC